MTLYMSIQPQYYEHAKHGTIIWKFSCYETVVWQIFMLKNISSARVFVRLINFHSCLNYKNIEYFQIYIIVPTLISWSFCRISWSFPSCENTTVSSLFSSFPSCSATEPIVSRTPTPQDLWSWLELNHGDGGSVSLLPCVELKWVHQGTCHVHSHQGSRTEAGWLSPLGGIYLAQMTSWTTRSTFYSLERVGKGREHHVWFFSWYWGLVICLFMQRSTNIT